jgi:hypothetical protein
MWTDNYKGNLKENITHIGKVAKCALQYLSYLLLDSQLLQKFSMNVLVSNSSPYVSEARTQCLILISGNAPSRSLRFSDVSVHPRRCHLQRWWLFDYMILYILYYIIIYYYYILYDLIIWLLLSIVAISRIMFSCFITSFHCVRSHSLRSASLPYVHHVTSSPMLSDKNSM